MSRPSINHLLFKKVCWIFDDRATYSVLISFCSIIKSNPGQKFIFYFIIPPDLALDITNFSHFLQYGSKIEIKHYRSKHLLLNSYYNVSCGWPKIILAKFWLYDILPEVDKILYLDTDIINVAPISQIWNISLCNKSIAATKRIHFDYVWINSGVIFYNLDFIRTLPSEVWNCARHNSCFIDDYWHTLCHKPEWIYFLPYRYNVEFYPIRNRMKRSKDQIYEEDNAVFFHMKDLAHQFYNITNKSEIKEMRAVRKIKKIRKIIENLFELKKSIDSELYSFQKQK